MLAPRVNAAGRMSTPDIATRLLLATDEAHGRRGAGAGAAARRRERPAPGGRGRDPGGGQEDRRRPIPTSARARCSSSPARAGIAASSASSPRSSSTRSTGRRSCCRSRATSRTGRAAASRASTCSARSSGARTCSMRFGGHKQAAGLTMEAARIRELRAAVNDVRRRDARARRPEAAAAHRWRPGVPRHHGRRGGRASRRWRRSAPATRGRCSPPGGVEIVDGPRKLKERHLKMALKQDGRIFRAIAWRAAERHDYLAEHQRGARRRVLARAEPVQRRDATSS